MRSGSFIIEVKTRSNTSKLAAFTLGFEIVNIIASSKNRLANHRSCI